MALAFQSFTVFVRFNFRKLFWCTERHECAPEPMLLLWSISICFIVRALFSSLFLISVLLPLSFFFAERMKSSLCLVSYFGWPVHSKAGMISTPISSSVSWVEQHWQRQTNKRTNDETIGTMKEERAIVREREIFVFFFLHLNRKAAENAALMMLMMMWCVARRNGKKAKQLSSRSGNSKIRKENKKMWRSRDKQFEWMENRK